MAENSQEITRNPAEHLAEYQWKPGQTGNAGGRPKRKLVDRALEELLEEADSTKALAIAKALIEQAVNKDVAAARLIAERTEGKPIQKVEHSGPDGSPVQGLIRVEFVKA